MAISPVSSSNVLSNAVQQTTGNQALGQDAFLKLLVTQLTNQDPLQPQDNSQFLAQLAQFSTVEGVNNVAASQQKLQASNLLGKTVDALVVANNQATPVSGKVTAVKFDASGVHVSVEGSQDDLTLDQIQQVRDQ